MLSGGQRQRLALDRLWRARGFTAVLITHDVGEAVALADRILVLAEGRLAADVSVPLPRDPRHGPAATAPRDQILAAI